MVRSPKRVLAPLKRASKTRFHFFPRARKCEFFVCHNGSCKWSDAMHMVPDVALVCTKKISRTTNRCDAYGPMLFLFVQKRSVGLQTDAMHMVRCGAYGPTLFLFVQKRSVGLQTDAMHMVRCGAYGPTLFLFVQKRSVGLQTDAMHMVRCDAYGPMRCTWSDAMYMVRCDAVHMVRCCSCLYEKDQSDYKPTRCIRSDAMHMVRCCLDRSVGLQTDAMRCIWSDAVLLCTNLVATKQPMLPKRRLWKGLQKMKCGCLIDFLMVRIPKEQFHCFDDVTVSGSQTQSRYQD